MIKPRTWDGQPWIRDWATEAAVYRLDPVSVIDGEVIEYVIVSSTLSAAGPEAIVFPADPLGRQLSPERGGHTDMGFCYGKRSHRLALENAGYLVAGGTAQEGWR